MRVQSPDSVEATSLLGKPLARPPIADPAARARMEADAAAAFDKVKQEPSAEAIIWFGRRTAYLGKFREAIQIYTGGLRLYPTDARLLRHRGHRYLTVRELEMARADLQTAAGIIKGQPDEVEPDGQPNARGIPTSTLHSNIWYHLALARYLKADYAGAADDWRRARDAVKNADNLVAASHWLYLSLRRAGRDAEAKAGARSDSRGSRRDREHQLSLPAPDVQGRTECRRPVRQDAGRRRRQCRPLRSQRLASS